MVATRPGNLKDEIGMKNKLFLAGILVICIATAVTVSFYSQRQQEMERIRSLEERMQEVYAERVNVAEKIRATENERQRLQNELDRHSKKIQLFKADISKTQQSKEKLLAELSNKNRNFSILEDRLYIIIQQKSELYALLQKAKSDCQDVILKLESAREEKAALEEEIKSRISPPRGVELKKIVVKLTPPLEGRVLDVNKEYNFVIIDLGEKDNIKSGDVFGIYRKDQLIAKAVAENIYEDMSSIIVLDEWLDVPILSGDTVKL